jgi:hypothetical protein
MTTFDPTLGASVSQAVINFSASGDNIIVPGVAGQKIKVLQYFFVIAAATNLTFKSGTTAITGPLDFGSNAADVQDFIQLPLTCLNPGDAFIINSSAAVQVGGTIWYISG